MQMQSIFTGYFINERQVPYLSRSLKRWFRGKRRQQSTTIKLLSYQKRTLNVTISFLCFSFMNSKCHS